MTFSDPQLDHEKLDVYQCAIQFLHVAVKLTRTMPRGETELRDQLKRAAMSIPLNIAEGSGRPTAADRAGSSPSPVVQRWNAGLYSMSARLRDSRRSPMRSREKSSW